MEEEKSVSGSEQKPLSEHDQRKLERMQKEEARAEEIASRERKKKLKRSVIWGVVILLVGSMLWLGYSGYKNKPQSYTSGQVHWHALVNIELCGQKEDLMHTKSSTMVSPMLTHTHGDNKIHIEGQIFRKEDIALGKFMDGINVPFSGTKIKDKQNGNKCPDGTVGTVKMFVNDQPNTEFRNYVPKDGDTIRIVFGS